MRELTVCMKVFALAAMLGCPSLDAQVATPGVPARPEEKEQHSAYKSFLLDPKLKAREEETGERQDDAAGRIDWWRQHMGGELTTEFKQRLISEAEKERAKFPGIFLGDAGAPLQPVAVTGTSWTPIGPTDASKEQNGLTYFKVDSGRARTILPVPGDPNTVYFLTSGGGLWKTSNFLANPPTWTALTDSVGSTSGGSAAFGGASGTLNPNVVFVGFGDPFDGGVGGIMAKTSDGGSTFPAPTKIVLPAVTKIYDVKVDFSGASEMVLAGTNVGIFRSTNGGASYASVGTLSTGQVWSIVRTGAGWLASVDVTGTTTFYLSTDNGATWSSSTGVSTPGGGIGRTTLAVGLPGDMVVYAFATTTSAAAQKDLYRSANGGATWTPTGTNSTTTPTNPNADQPNNDYMGGQSFYNHMVLVDPTDATRNTVFVGGNLSTARSADGGVTWTVKTNWLAQFGLPYAHADFHAAAFFMGSPNRIYFGSDGGLFVSADAGATWDDTKNKGLQTHLIYGMTCGFNGGANKNSVLIGLQDNGTRLRNTPPTTGTVTTVYDQTRGGDGFGVGWSQANNAWTLSSYVYNAIQRCTTNPPDDQSKWLTFTSGLTPTNSASYFFVTPIIGAPASSDLGSTNPGMNFYTYGNSGTGTNSKKIFKTIPTGWITIGTAGVGGLDPARFVRATSHGIGVSPLDLNHIAAAGNGGVALITTDGGTTWTERIVSTLGVPAWPGFNSNLAWADNSKLYLCSVSTAAAVPHVAKSTDGGATWADITPGLPDVPVVKLAVDPGDATGNTVYAATWLGLYRTTNGGGSWAPFGTGQPQGLVWDIYVAPDSSFMRIGYFGRGVWEISGSVLPGPTITTQPANQTVSVGQTATFTVVATGTGTLSYQWKKNTVNVGTNSPSYTTPATSLGDSGSQFQVVVTDTAGSTNSGNATLTVNPVTVGPTITTQPTTQTVTFPQQATFSVSAFGTGTLSYQWKKNGSDIAGATGSSYTTPLTTLGDNGALFRVAVGDNAGVNLSNTAALNVNACAGGSTSQIFLNPGFESGNTTWVTTSTASSPAIIDVMNPPGNAHTGSWYAWLDGYATATTETVYQQVSIPAGASAATLKFWLQIGTSETGSVANDTLSCQVRNSSGALLATLATYSNLNASAYTQKTFNLLAYQGQTVRIYFEGIENGSLGTSFFLDDFELNVTTGSTSTMPAITTQPISQNVALGGSATFSVAATGTAPLYYQWRKNGTAISGASTSASYSIPSVQVGNAGSYDVQVGNCAGTATSAAATLSVSAISVSISPSGPQGILLNGTRNFSATVTGTGNTAVTWSVTGGSLNSTSSNPVTFTAPGSVATVTLTATSVADTSKSASVTINVLSRDLTGDGTIDVLDLGLILKAYTGAGVIGAPNYNPLADLDGDGDVDDDDINLFLAGF